MPYFFVLLAFAAASIAASIGTTFTWLYRPLRPVFPFAWRAWLWGTVGFVLANAVLLSAVWITLRASDAIRPELRLQKATGIIAAALTILGPFVASAVGTGSGVLLGCFLAWRAGSVRKEV